MNRDQANDLVRQTFTQAFDKVRFHNFTLNLLNRLDESKAFTCNSQYVKEAFRGHVQGFERLGTYTSPENEKMDVLIVHLTHESKLERARTAIRNFVADHLKTRGEKDAALVAFVSPSKKTWRFSYVKMEYATLEKDAGKVDVEARLTPARRFSYIVGEGESCHTAQTRFLDLLQDTEKNPALAHLEEAFSVEAVTKEFYTRYAELFGEIHKALEKLVAKDETLREEFAARGVNTVDFTKKLMGQIVFLYFLQKKGWLGVARGRDWGSGPRDFLRRLAKGEYGKYGNFFNDILEPLFYDTLATDRGHEAWCNRFECRIPFLNGGLFEPPGDYNWRKTDIILPNRLFTNSEFVEEGITGTGVLDVFDRYNFTVNEAEPLEREVAIDPEMLGKVFENLIEDNRRKGLGAYYTPREIVHYMCQESLINYLDTALNHTSEVLETSEVSNAIPRADIETFVHLGEQISHYEAVETAYRIRMPKSIEPHARLIDDKLAEITICDPAVGSGAFPVGMMTEIVRARSTLTPYFNDVHERTPYHFKRHAIQNCLYGVDIDAGAVEIAKLRLWLSLVVDEEDVKQIKPLPNLDYKIVAGNSLLGFPFKSQRLAEIEKLKDNLFDETDHAKIAQLKAQVDRLLTESFAASKKSLGYEVSFDFRIFFSEVLGEKGGFDIILANPPYLGEKGNKETFRHVRQGPLGKFYIRKMDLLYFFFHLALNLARENSQIALITTNYYLTADGASKLRKAFKDHATIRKLINFNELKIFESALGQHSLITLLSKGKNIHILSAACITKRTGIATSSILNRILNWEDNQTKYYAISQPNLYEGDDCYIRLTGKSSNSGDLVQSILHKVKLQGQNLDIFCNISQGILTGVDRITNRHVTEGLVDIKYLNHGVYILNKEELAQLNLMSAERQIVKPFFKNSDIQKYVCSSQPKRFIIYATRDLDINQFPNLKRHFNRFEPAIRARSQDRGEMQAALRLGKWWVIFATRTLNVFMGKKIVCPQRSYQNTFAYNEIPWLASADVYFITEKDRNVKLKYILALLNSKLYYLWLYHRGKRKGEMLELLYTPLTQIPIKHLSYSEQNPFIETVDKILDAKRRGPEADTSALEQEIDQLVYKLYDLTPEEIAIVEEATRGK